MRPPPRLSRHRPLQFLLLLRSRRPLQLRPRLRPLRPPLWLRLQRQRFPPRLAHRHRLFLRLQAARSRRHLRRSLERDSNE